MNWPFIDSAVISKFVFKLTPLPKKLFSLRPAPIVSPSVPKPAATEISPVGLSSTFKSITLNASSEPFCMFDSTFLNMPKLWRLLIDLLNKISLNGSPSSTIKLLRITSSSVLKFPLILTFSI